MTSHPRAPRVVRALLVLGLTVSCLALLASSAFASPAHARAHAAGNGPTARMSRRLNAAARAHTRADHALVSRALAMRHCLKAHPHHCAKQRRAVQRAGTKLAKTERRLSRISRSRSASVSRATTPQLSIAGTTLTWTPVAGARTYIGVRHVPGQGPEYAVVKGTSFTPPPVLGATVSYSIRTATPGSTWAHTKSISYPAAPTAVDTKAAPQISVDGQTLSWKAVGDVDTYVSEREVPGKEAEYSVVDGTSVTPPAAPGATVLYTVRTAVDGSAWAPEVSITYPAASGDGSDEGSTGSGGSSKGSTGSGSGSGTTSGSGAGVTSGAFEMGIGAASTASTEPEWIGQLGARTVRMEFSINTPVSQLEPVMAAYARAGERPLLLAGFASGMPSTAEAQNVGRWAAAFGPGGSFWQGKSFPAGTAVTRIEFGNETSYTYQYSDNSTAGVTARAESYALRFKDAEIAIQAANPSVGLLAQADNGGSGSPVWVNGMFAAVPDLAQRVAGWTVHPYGPNWQTRMDQLVSETQAAGAPSTIPIYVTEWGLATDNGHCLSDNYGFNKCMSYNEAASTLSSTVSAMRARYGSRLAALYIYQAHDRAASGASNERELYFGTLQSSGAAKGAYTNEVKALYAENP